MKKRGVSNLVAAVLLIIITLSIASVLYAWSTGWVSEQLGKVQEISQGELAFEVGTLVGSTDTGTLIVRNVGTDPIRITNEVPNVLLTLYMNGNIIPPAKMTAIVDSTTGGTSLLVANAKLQPDHVMTITLNLSGSVDVIAGTTYEVKITLSDGTPLIVAIKAT